jgi:hypothetical protein
MQSDGRAVKGGVNDETGANAVWSRARRLFAALPFVALAIALAPAPAPAEGPTVAVYKTPTCGCCTKWIEHLQAAGFEVEATELESLTMVKASNGVPRPLTSCHTALVEGYVIEGHVPAEDIRRLLAERPAVSGLAVPGMPLGSPGMEHPDATRHEDYEVLSFGPDGVAVFTQHGAGSRSRQAPESR